MRFNKLIPDKFPAQPISSEQLIGCTILYFLSNPLDTRNEGDQERESDSAQRKIERIEVGEEEKDN